MQKLLTNLFDFERDDSVGEVLYYRIFELFIAYWVLYFAWTWGFYILKIGDVVLPLGIATHIDISFMFENNLSLFNAGAMTVLVALGFFRISRWGYFGALLLLHLQYVTRFCLGEISHGSNVIGMVLLGMSVGTLIYTERKQVRRFVYGFSYFFLGLGYSSAALCKLVATGPLWVDGSNMWLWIAERTVDTFSIAGVASYNWVQQLALDFHPVATLILTFGLLTEFFGFLMWFKRTRIVIMILLIMMHVGILLSMKINFPANNVVLVLLALPWAAYIDRGLKMLDEVTFDKLKRASLRLT